MLFSIIVPVFNTENYLLQCIDSILKQTFRNFEVIFVDDGSTDKSPLLLDETSKKDERVSIYHKENGGLVSARKFGCLKAKGDYIVTIDSDDFIQKDFLSNIAMELEKNRYPDLIITGYSKVDNDGNPVGGPVLNEAFPGLYKGVEVKSIQDNFLYSKDIKGLNFGCFIFSTWTKIVKKGIYVENQNKVDDCIKLGEDLVFTSFLINSVKSVVISNYVGYCYRQSETSMAHHLSCDSFFQFEATVKQLKSIFENNINKVYIYSKGVLLNCIFSLAKQCDDYSQFKNAFIKSYDCRTLWSFANKAKYKMRVNDAVKHIFLKFHLKFFIYLIARHKKSKAIF